MPRKDDIRMTDEEIRAYLQEGHTVTLVTNGPKGFPHAVAMFYALDLNDDDIVIKFATYASSQKVKNAQKDPRCTLLIETGHAYSELRGLMIAQGNPFLYDPGNHTEQARAEAEG